MNTQPEIKVGQRWRFPSDKVKQRRAGSVVVEVKAVDDLFVYLRDTKKPEGYVVTVSYFRETYEPVPEPKTRHITADDLMKMLAVNPVLYYASVKDPEIWHMLTRPGDWAKGVPSAFRFSHNPFAPNAKIVGPEIEVV